MRSRCGKDEDTMAIPGGPKKSFENAVIRDISLENLLVLDIVKSHSRLLKILRKIRKDAEFKLFTSNGKVKRHNLISHHDRLREKK